MKRILLISMLTLFPLCSNAQYNGNLGVGILYCPMLGVIADQCGRGCTHPNSGKPCDIDDILGPFKPLTTFPTNPYGDIKIW